MQDIWGRRTESGLSAEELREELCLHLARNLGEPHIAFSDQDGWAGKSREPGPPVDVMVVPPEGERRFGVDGGFLQVVDDQVRVVTERAEVMGAA